MPQTNPAIFFKNDIFKELHIDRTQFFVWIPTAKYKQNTENITN